MQNGLPCHGLVRAAIPSWEPGALAALREFREWLLGCPTARYSALKRRLAALHYNGDDYTRAKTELIPEPTDRARAECGLPPALAWEE